MTGLVQGVGMRPAIARFAKQLLLNGYVYNSMAGVEVYVEGEADSINRFRNELNLHWPKQANVGSCDFLQALSAEIAVKVASTYPKYVLAVR